MTGNVVSTRTGGGDERRSEAGGEVDGTEIGSPRMVLSRVRLEAAGICKRWPYFGQANFRPDLSSAHRNAFRQVGQAKRIIGGVLRR